MSTDQPAKPVHQLLRDISQTISDRETRGVIAPRILNWVAFGASVISILLVSAALLLAIWDAIEPLNALKFIASVFVVLIAILTFREVNGKFVE